MNPENDIIYLVEDDPEIRDLVSELLSSEGLDVRSFENGAAFDLAYDTEQPTLVLLDVMLPGEDGLSICRRLRAESDVPIFILTAKGDDIDRIIGIELGADDYLPKPFNPRELIARVRALLRRSRASTKHPTTQGSAEPLHVADLIVDAGSRSVRRSNGEPLSLSTAEFDLLLALAEANGRVLSRAFLLERVFGRDATPFDRSVDVLVSRLRKKIEPNPSRPTLLKTVRNSGYILVLKPEGEA